MKTIYITAIVAGLLSLCITAIPAQTTQNKLNQMELDRKFNGTWKADAGKDTIFIIVCKSMYSGVETLFKIETKGKTIFEEKSLLGLNKKTGKMTECSVDNISPNMEVYACWFTSESVMEEVPIEEISNPEKASFRMTFEFKSPDMFVLTYREQAKVTGRYNFRRDNKI